MLLMRPSLGGKKEYVVSRCFASWVRTKVFLFGDGWVDVFLREGPPGQGAILLDVLYLILRLVIEIKFSLYFLFFKAAF